MAAIDGYVEWYICPGKLVPLGGCDVDAQHPDAEFGLVRCDHRDRISAGNALDDAFLNTLEFYLVAGDVPGDGSPVAGLRT